jgi:CDP-glycerol glycerophosphotransferase
VSRFTFAKGNAEKVLALPVYALGALASVLVPRRRNHWVFGCGSGVGEGALALFLEARASDPTLTLTWLARNSRDEADASRLGIPTAPVMSWRGFWLTLRAEVLVVTHGFGDVNRFGTRGGFIVQLWHGIPLKLIHLDSPATMHSPILPNSSLVKAALRFLYRGASRAIDLMPAASELAASRLRTAFALPASRVVVTGDPRDDVLSQGSDAGRISTARHVLASRLGDPALASGPPYPRVLLQAPTWRDGATDPGIPTMAQWRSIADYLEQSASHLVIRPHPLSVGDYGVGPTISGRIHLLTSAEQPDITPVLPAVDLLVTDYSSIAYDYALTGGEILYLAPDVAAYSSSRGLYEPYSTFSGGREVANWDELLEALRRRDSDPVFRGRLLEHSHAVARRNHEWRDGRNTFRVYTEIVSRLKGTS